MRIVELHTLKHRLCGLGIDIPTAVLKDLKNICGVPCARGDNGCCVFQSVDLLFLVTDGSDAREALPYHLHGSM